MGARRAAGVRRWGVGSLWVDGPFAMVSMVVTAAVVYAVSWTGWFLSTYGYDRQWAADNPGKGITWLPPAVRSLVHYHQEMWTFNTTLSTPHPYQSNPWGWLVQARPTSFFYEGPKLGVNGCTVEQCSKAINPVGTISVWWLGVIALAFVVWHWLVRRDWRAGGIAAGIVGGYLPWFLYQHRTIFTFYCDRLRAVGHPRASSSSSGSSSAGASASPERRRRGPARHRRVPAADVGDVRVLLPDLHGRGDPVHRVAPADVVPQLGVGQAASDAVHPPDRPGEGAALVARAGPTPAGGGCPATRRWLICSTTARSSGERCGSRR